MFIYFYLAPQGDIPSDCKTVFVKNLPYNTNAEAIGDAFRHCGEI